MSKDTISAFFILFAAMHVFENCRRTLRAMTPTWKTTTTALVFAVISVTAMYSLHPYRDMYAFHASAVMYGVSLMGLTLELFFTVCSCDWLDEIDEPRFPGTPV